MPLERGNISFQKACHPGPECTRGPGLRYAIFAHWGGSGVKGPAVFRKIGECLSLKKWFVAIGFLLTRTCLWADDGPQMKLRPFCLFLCLAILLTAAPAFAEQPWTEVRSPHFRVLTDGSASDARHVAREFEQMRYVFATEYPSFRLESGAPLTIFAARDEDTAKSLDPLLWKALKKEAKPTADFHYGWEKQYIMVRLDATDLATQQEAFREYTESILRMNAHWLPAWLNSGLTAFYGYTRFDGDKIYIGAPPATARRAYGTPIPVEDLMTPRKLRSFYRDPQKENVFYAESWALVHYLTFGPNMGLGAKLSQFFSLIQNGAPQKQAFQQVFGSFGEIDKGLDEYMRLFSFKAAVLRNPPQINEKTFTTEKLTLAQTYAELAAYQLWTKSLAQAQPWVDKALKADPNIDLAHEVKGFILFTLGNDAAASGEFLQAYKLDPKLYLSLFAKTMLSPAASLKTAADQAEFSAAIMKVIDINPLFAPAYVQMARFDMRQNNLQGAFGVARRAEELEPWRAGYHLLTGQILLRMGKYTQAADYARYVAQHWSITEHDEAVELWNQVPVADRPVGVTLTDEIPPGTQTATGIVQSVYCAPATSSADKHAIPQGPPSMVTLSVYNDSGSKKSVIFLRIPPFTYGFSDTLWWGKDHFNTCFNLQGLRAVIRYRPPAEPGYAGSIVELSILDTLPKADAAMPTKAPTTTPAQ